MIQDQTNFLCQSRGQLRGKITMSDQPGTIWGEIFVQFLVDLLKNRANFLQGRKLVYFFVRFS